MFIMALKAADSRSKNPCYPLLSECRRFEMLDGVLGMIPVPDTRHQAVALRMASALLERIEAGNLGLVLQAPYSVMLSRDTVVQPDILYLRRERRGIIGSMNLHGAPDLVIEVLSKGTRLRDLTIKRKIYARFEIAEYWVVDPDTDTAEILVWSELGYASAGVFKKTDRLSSPMLPLGIPLSGIFRTDTE
jgi:Uma2 family endonuclease